MDPEYQTPGHPMQPPTMPPAQGLSFQHVYPICAVSGWLKFLGILNIIVGVLYCITIIGAIFGWIPLWIGILLNRAGGSLRMGFDGSNALDIEDGLKRLSTAIKIIGVLTIIGLALNVVYIIFFLLVIVGAGTMGP